MLLSCISLTITAIASTLHLICRKWCQFMCIFDVQTQLDTYLILKWVNWTIRMNCDTRSCCTILILVHFLCELYAFRSNQQEPTNGMLANGLSNGYLIFFCVKIFFPHKNAYYGFCCCPRMVCQTFTPKHINSHNLFAIKCQRHSKSPFANHSPRVRKALQLIPVLRFTKHA